jgi:RimJ/RimL family protein N-acetyltransferase
VISGQPGRRETLTSLAELSDADFEWILERKPQPGGRLTLPPEGIDDPATLMHVRGIVRRLQDANCAARWMIVSDGEVVGLCSYLRPPENGTATIGYGVAEKRRRLGHATRAVAAVIRAAEADPQVQILTAETSVNNPASSRVLEKNGFCRAGTRVDPEDGDLIVWQRVVG